MPRFAILAHDWPTPHWDLFLEAGPVLRSWRLLAEPVPGSAVPAEPIGDHRPLYLDYEGPVSGDRGEVRRWDAGTFEGDAPPDAEWSVRFSGRRLRGTATMRRPAAGWQFRAPHSPSCSDAALGTPATSCCDTPATVTRPSAI